MLLLVHYPCEVTPSRSRTLSAEWRSLTLLFFTGIQMPLRVPTSIISFLVLVTAVYSIWREREKDIVLGHHWHHHGGVLVALIRLSSWPKPMAVQCFV